MDHNAYMKEISDLRTRLEEAERERENYKFSCEYTEAERDTVRVENAVLKQKLEKAHMDLANAEHNVAENTKQEIMMWIDKCIALEQKLVAVREWVKLYDPDWDNDINKLKKILDGE